MNLKDLLPKTPRTIDDLRKLLCKAALAAFQIDTVEAEKKASIAIINEQYGNGCAKQKKELARAEKSIEGYARSHRDDLFGSKQRVTIDGHRLGLHHSPGKLAYDEKADELIQKITDSDDDELADIGLVIAPTLDAVSIKAEILAESPLGQKFVDLGFRVVKDETFKLTLGVPEDDAA